MIVRKMTASFGVLQNRTLELSPGLNIVEAPNEYGKTTWCAFLRAMLYGIDTAQRGRAGKKPDKVLYAPWSGSPMAGTMEITFGGKDITLSRSTRIPSAPMRVFSAVYSRSGQSVLDLSGENAGETLTARHCRYLSARRSSARRGSACSRARSLKRRSPRLSRQGRRAARFRRRRRGCAPCSESAVTVPAAACRSWKRKWRR